jgi:hypothetical protein
MLPAHSLNLVYLELHNAIIETAANLGSNTGIVPTNTPSSNRKSQRAR